MGMLSIRAVSGALLFVGGAALVPLVTPDVAHARPENAGFTRSADNDVTLQERRGPFYGLRVNSMDVDAEAKVLAVFRYRCPPLIENGRADTYHVVRSIQADRDVAVGDCDEILGTLLGDRAVRYQAVFRTTRWIRDVGPNGETPVGGFLGTMDIDAVVRFGDGEVLLPYLDFRMVGTQGLRPRRGDPDTTPDADEVGRCDAPFHDEGYYDGVFDRRGLRRLASVVDGDALAIERLRRLAATRFVGTFEGRTFLDEARERRFDFRELERVVWWMDGVAGFRCRKAPDVADDSPPDVTPAELPSAAR